MPQPTAMLGGSSFRNTGSKPSSQLFHRAFTAQAACIVRSHLCLCMHIYVYYIYTATYKLVLCRAGSQNMARLFEGGLRFEPFVVSDCSTAVTTLVCRVPKSSFQGVTMTMNK